MIPIACDGCGGEPVATYHAREPGGDLRWRLCRLCLVTVAEERIDADGSERGWIGDSLDAERRAAWEAMLQAANWMAGVCHGETAWSYQKAQKPYACEVCFGTIERGDRYGRLIAGGGRKRRDWNVCGNCCYAPESIPFVELPRESWRKSESRGVLVYTETGEEIPF